MLPLPLSPDEDANEAFNTAAMQAGVVSPLPMLIMEVMEAAFVTLLL